VATIPNALSWPLEGRSRLESRTVVAAGRLVRRKGMGRLIRAYLPVARAHPDWQLLIYGRGGLQADLQALIERRGVVDQVRLMGHTDDLAAALESASLFATASRAEGFPMVLLEAMSKGLPLVAFDCPRGPRDIVRDGENGRLVPNGDIPAFTAALEDLVGDEQSLRRMGARARADAATYSMDGVVARWEALFDTIREHRAGGGGAGPGRRHNSSAGPMVRS
jgi:glycosyltransferase involved in cell wall biosynthesis